MNQILIGCLKDKIFTWKLSDLIETHQLKTFNNLRSDKNKKKDTNKHHKTIIKAYNPNSEVPN